MLNLIGCNDNKHWHLTNTVFPKSDKFRVMIEHQELNYIIGMYNDFNDALKALESAFSDSSKKWLKNDTLRR